MKFPQPRNNRLSDSWYDANANGRKDPLHPKYREKPSPSKKDRRRWCRGKPGVEHDPRLVLPSGAGPGRPCRPAETWVADKQYLDWSCDHAMVCARCQRIMWRGLGADCPDYPAGLELDPFLDHRAPRELR